MRLIDADKFIQELVSKYPKMENDFGMEFNTFTDKVKEVCNNQPTAYNVDKVVEQLEQKAWEVNIAKMPRYERGKRDAYYDAIEIVKAGGLNE